MQPELSIILPVRNLATEISSRLQRLLDFVPDLTVNFEIIAVDDCSADLTAEIIADLSTSYPQITLKRNHYIEGFLKAIETGYERAKAKRVFVVEPDVSIQPSVIQQFWLSGAPNNLFQTANRNPIKPLEDQLFDRLEAWCNELKQEQVRANTSPSDQKRIDQPQPNQAARNRAPLRIPIRELSQRKKTSG